MAPFDLVLSEAAARTFALASRGEQRKLGQVFDQLKAAPSRPGDLQERDSAGVENQILVVDDWIVTYRPDHAVREMRLVRLERVEG